MNYKFIALLIACASLAAAVNVRAQTSDNKPALVKITGEMMGVRQCIRPIDENRQEEQAALQFRLSITNLSSRPLIIYRYDPAVFDARLARTVADLPNQKYGFEERPPFRFVPPRIFEEQELTSEFRVLKPNESFTYEYPESITFAGTKSFASEKDPLCGDYFLQLKVATWIWEVEKAKRLQQRWARYGDFFYEDVTTEPFPFTINKPGAATPRCNTQ